MKHLGGQNDSVIALIDINRDWFIDVKKNLVGAAPLP